MSCMKMASGRARERKFRVDGITFECGKAGGSILFVAHADPNVCVYHVCVRDSFGGIRQHEGWRRAGVSGAEGGFLHAGAVQLIGGGRRDDEATAYGGDAEGETAGHIVAIADEGYAEAVEPSFRLSHGLQIRHSLAGVLPIGKGVDDHYGGAVGELFQGGVGVDAGNYAVHVSGEDLGDVGDGFADAQADFGAAAVEAVTAKLVDADFEAAAGAEGGLFRRAGLWFARQGRWTRRLSSGPKPFRRWRLCRMIRGRLRIGILAGSSALLGRIISQGTEGVQPGAVFAYPFMSGT